MTTLLRCLPFVLLCALFAAPASAQVSTGLRAGASVDPDQFYFGAHLETPELADNLSFRPNIEVGLGDDATLVALNFELAYKFRTRRPWRPYLAAGPALLIADTNDETGAHGGFNIAIGIEHRRGLFGELKLGTIDSPDFKIGIGFRF
jgi:hypothetical protein